MTACFNLDDTRKVKKCYSDPLNNHFNKTDMTEWRIISTTRINDYLTTPITKIKLYIGVKQMVFTLKS